MPHWAAIILNQTLLKLVHKKRKNSHSQMIAFVYVLICSLALVSSQTLRPEVQRIGGVCWKPSFAVNTVFLNTLGGPFGNNPPSSVQMGYLSAIYDQYPNFPSSGTPKITREIAKQKCAALGIQFCRAVQWFSCPEEEKFTWANLLTPYEYNTYKSIPQTLAAASNFTAYAFEIVECRN